MYETYEYKMPDEILLFLHAVTRHSKHSKLIKKILRAINKLYFQKPEIDEKQNIYLFQT